MKKDYLVLLNQLDQVDSREPSNLSSVSSLFHIESSLV